MMRLRTLAEIAAFVWIPAVQAYTMVWFETPSYISNWPGSLPAGGPGQSLNLICDSTLNGECTWQIQMRAALGTGGIVGWSLDLRTSPGNGVSILNPQIVPGPFNNSAFAGTGGTGPALLFGAHGQTFSPPPMQTLTLMIFTLRRSITTGDLSLATILGGPSLDSTIVWANESTGITKSYNSGQTLRPPHSRERSAPFL